KIPIFLFFGQENSKNQEYGLSALGVTHIFDHQNVEILQLD
ncbi:hypothetical protein LCGC14_2135160, partial [marine sediment metagenome]